MATVVTTFTATEFTVTPPGFSSTRRYLRVASGGAIGVSAGRTWRISNISLTNTGFPWIGQRWDVGSYGSFAITSTTVSGNTQTVTVAAVSPVITSCTL